MPRPPRIVFENAWYHVMNRAGAKRLAFFKDHHRRLFLELIAEITERFELEIHAYCLMDNHFHLLVRTPKANISEAIQRLLCLYTRRFNREERLDGALFRGRFKAIIVTEENYLYQVSRYIHLNPVEANLCRKPDDYRWSSYAAYVGKVSAEPWLHRQFILNQFGQTQQQHHYKQYVENPNQPSLKQFYGIKHIPSILGSKQARRKVYSNAVLLSNEVSIPQWKNPLEEMSIRLKCEPADLLRSCRGVKNTLRNQAIFALRNQYGMKVVDIAKLFQLKPTSISTVLAQMEQSHKF